LKRLHQRKFATPNVQPEGKARSTSWHCKTQTDSAIATLLLASVAAGNAWLFLFTSGRFVEQLRALMDAWELR
jgi:hypothetical protein